jgi:hypothetical protein
MLCVFRFSHVSLCLGCNRIWDKGVCVCDLYKRAKEKYHVRAEQQWAFKGSRFCLLQSRNFQSFIRDGGKARLGKFNCILTAAFFIGLDQSYRLTIVDLCF